MSIISSANNALGGYLKGIPLVGAGVSSLEAGINADKIEKLAKKRPKYTRPDEINQYLENAKASSTSEMPGLDLAKQGIDQSVATGIANVKNLSDNPTSSLASVQQLAKNQMNMYSNLAMQNTQFHQQEKQKLQQALQQAGHYSDQEFEYNVNQPRQFDMNWAQNKYQANQADARQNTQNTYALASNIIGGMTGGVGSGKQTATFDPYSIAQARNIGTQSNQNIDSTNW